MGVMRFLVHPPSRVTDELAQRVYMSGLDRVPWPSRAHVTSEGLSVERSVGDSGNVHVPWQVPGFGEVTLSTSSLMERERPYHLQVELARGKVNQLRSQLADWQAIGMTAPKELHDRIHESVELFALAATSQHQPAVAAAHAERTISVTLDAAMLLVNAFTEQALAARYQRSSRLGTHLAANLGPHALDDATAKQARASFNTALVPMNWQDIEAAQGKQNWSTPDAQLAWCHQQGMHVHAGPLLRLDLHGLPDWLYLWEGDFDNILSFAGEHVERTVNRYRGKVHLWHCASRVNTGSVLSLREVDKQRLAVRAIEIVRKLDPATPVIINFDQPWAEYMSHEEVEPPAYFAELLCRAGVGLSGIGLEINLGYYPGGTYPRDMLEFNGLIDRWSLTGLPLFLLLTVPSSDQPDKLARVPCKLISGAATGGSTQGSQNLWISRFLPMLLAKPMVQGVIWNQLQDSQPHDFPHGGLFDAAGSPKSALTTLAALRRAHLV